MNRASIAFGGGSQVVAELRAAHPRCPRRPRRSLLHHTLPPSDAPAAPREDCFAGSVRVLPLRGDDGQPHRTGRGTDQVRSARLSGLRRATGNLYSGRN